MGKTVRLTSLFYVVPGAFTIVMVYVAVPTATGEVVKSNVPLELASRDVGFVVCAVIVATAVLLLVALTDTGSVNVFGLCTTIDNVSLAVGVPSGLRNKASVHVVDC